GNEGGVAANSVASGVAIVQLNSQFINWTGGALTILDPHANATASNTLAYNNSTAHVNVPNTHTLRLGDGVSTDAGGNATNGFRLNTWAGSNRILFGNLEVNTLGGTNRIVTTTYSLGFSGNVTIEPSSEVLFATSYVAGNIVNNGTFTSTTSLFLANYLNGAETATTNAQTIGGIGVYRNLATTPTANLTSLTVNNTNATGVTLNIPLSVSGTLTMTSGIINTTNTNLLTLGTATAGGTLAGTPSATSMVRGPFARTISNANANTNYLLFPVGKVAYAPIWAAPATTAATVMKAETFDSNTGTQSAAIANMATNRRWELPLVSGTITDINVRLGDAGILATSIPVQAPSASGQYTSTFGSVATAVAGVSTQSTTPVLTANYTGFLSYADSNACVGVPTPGNTIASSNAICLGTSVTLSLQNLTTGSGVTYQWFSSPDGVTYSPIAAATNPTYSTTPTASTYFMCEVTCATGPSTAASVPVQVTFANEVTATVPATRCGTGTVDLSATPSSGATINWFAAATGGSPLASGSSFTTPTIASTTTYYAAASTASAGSLILGAGGTNSAATAASFLPGGWGGAKTQYIIRASELIQAGLTAGPITNLGFEPTNSGQTYQGFFVQIGHTATTTAPTTTFIPNTGLSFVYAGTEANDGFTPIAGSVNNLTFGTGAGTTSSFVWDGTSNIVVSISWSRVPAAATATSTTMKVDNVGFVSAAYRQRDNLTPTDLLNETSVTGTSSNRPRFTINGQLICSSPRVAVVATVSAPPALTLSGATATICSGDSSSAVTLTAG
ncbi:MAG: beta strand repeat-containing protein, partial [Bacteroidia bacterium]